MYSCGNGVLVVISRCPYVSGRDANVLLPNPKASRQTQAVLRPEHGPAQHTAPGAAQEQKEVSGRHTRHAQSIVHTRTHVHGTIRDCKFYVPVLVSYLSVCESVCLG